jgi:NAD(P) transhydrogenase subunit alpha
MQPGSVIVDVAIDQGGNCALTVGGEVTEEYGVCIDGTKNIPGMVPISSTWMFAKNIYNFVDYLIVDGKVNLNQEDDIIASTLVTMNGKVVHAGALEAMELA